MKKILAIAFIAFIALSANAFAEEAKFDVKVTLAQPFEIDSTAEANFGTLFTAGKAEVITMDASSVAVVVGDDAAKAKPTMTEGKILRGGPPVSMIAGQTVGVVYIKAVDPDVDVDVALVGTPELAIPYSQKPTPIKVTGLTSNKTGFNAATIAKDKIASLAIGPVIEIPVKAETGAYSGEITVNVTAI